MLVGYPPFVSDNQFETCKRIMDWKQYLKFPSEIKISSEAKDLIEKLVTDVDIRIGFTGASEIKSHPFFKSINWDNIRSITPAFVPSISHDIDTKYFDKFEEEDSFYPANCEKPKHVFKDICFINFDFERSEKAENLMKQIENPEFFENTLKQASSKIHSPKKSEGHIFRKIKPEDHDNSKVRSVIFKNTQDNLSRPILSHAHRELKIIDLSKCRVHDLNSEDSNNSNRKVENYTSHKSCNSNKNKNTEFPSNQTKLVMPRSSLKKCGSEVILTAKEKEVTIYTNKSIIKDFEVKEAKKPDYGDLQAESHLQNELNKKDNDHELKKKKVTIFLNSEQNHDDSIIQEGTCIPVLVAHHKFEIKSNGKATSISIKVR